MGLVCLYLGLFGLDLGSLWMYLGLLGFIWMNFMIRFLLGFGLGLGSWFVVLFHFSWFCLGVFWFQFGVIWVS